MDTLEKHIVNVVNEILKPEELVLRLIESKLASTGISLSRKQKSGLSKQLTQFVFDSVSIDLNWWQIRKIEKSRNDELILDLNIDDIESFENEVLQAIENTTQEVLGNISDSLLRNWKSKAPSLIKKQHKQQAGFNKVLNKKWGTPLDLLEILLGVSLQTGSDFNEYYRPQAVEENDFIFEVLTQLHARGCQVGREALLLLRNGYADGAHARWRTLHEISVDALFISNNGQDVAEKYLLHSTISEYRIAVEYEKHHSQINYAPPEQNELDELKNRRDELLNRFGKEYKRDYGWASETVGGKAPTFAKLEEFVGLDYMRPFYKLANINVHSGSKGANFRLGEPPTDSSILIAGPSVYGLGEPGQNLAYSFFLLTSTLLLSRKNLDNITFVSTINTILNETVWAFDDIMATEEQNGS